VVVAGARARGAGGEKSSLRVMVLMGLPSSDSLYGSVVAEAFRDHGLFSSVTVLRPSAPLRNALVATGRFLSIVQARRCIRPQGRRIKILPINMSHDAQTNRHHYAKKTVR